VNEVTVFLRDFPSSGVSIFIKWGGMSRDVNIRLLFFFILSFFYSLFVLGEYMYIAKATYNTCFVEIYLFPISKEAQDPQQYQLKKTGLLHPTGDIYLHGHGLSILSKFEQIVLKHNNLNKLISY
jgi:hypothetical protein